MGFPLCFEFVKKKLKFFLLQSFFNIWLPTYLYNGKDNQLLKMWS